jgi:hypothetical protein
MGKFSICDNGKSISMSDGTRIYYNGENERRIAREKVEAHATELENSIENRLGRRITIREALHGLQREPLGPQQENAQNIRWQDLLKAKPVVGPVVNPHEKRLADLLEQQERETMGEKEWGIRQDIKKFDADQAEKTRKEALANDPVRQAALARAKRNYDAAKWNSRVSAKSLDDLRRIVEAVQSGADLETIRQVSWTTREQVIADLAVEAKRALLLGEKYRQEEASLKTVFDLPDPVNENAADIVAGSETN